MAVTDDRVAALRAYLRARTDTEASDAERRFLTRSRTGRRDQYLRRGRTLTTTAWARAAPDDHPADETVLRREVAQLGA